MDENTQTQDEISLVYIFKLLLRKIKLLVIVLLVGAFVGAGLGVLRTFNKKQYGTTIEFYVNPRLDKTSSTEVESQYGVYGAYGRHVMDNMVKLLSSELFAEQLLLDEKTGLPKTGENANVDAKTAIALEAQTAAQAAVADAEEKLKALNEANTAYRNATTELNTLWQRYMNLNDTLNSTPTKGFYDDVDIKIQEQEDAKKAVTDAEAVLKTSEETAANAKKDAEEKKEEALELWRNTYATYSEELKLVISSISYSYYDEADEKIVSDLARSFIYVKISVLNDVSLAEKYYERIIELVPVFIETNMSVPSGYDGTNCQRITRSDKISRTNENVMVKTAMKYGLLLAAAAFVVACVAVIIVDRSDKRLRSVEQITDTFDIPVLGVIPTIQKNGEETAEKQTSTTEEQK